MERTARILVCFGLFFALIQGRASASLIFVSDLISPSAPSASIDHTITFTVNTAVPAGGMILITPESGSFDVPSGTDYLDVDFLVAQTPGNYVNRNIAAIPSATEDGVTVVTGTAGSISIDLNSSSGISAGNQVKILIGTNATYQATGDSRIINPSAAGSYRVDIRTQNGVQVIESARAIIAVIDQVTLAGEVQNVPPTMSNGNPSGAFSHTVTAVELWLNTDETASCKYSTSSGISYSAMPNTFSNTDDILHRTVVSGLIASTSYNYYVKCIDDDNNEPPSDLQISFSIRPVPPAGTIPGPVGGPEGSGGPPVTPPPPPPPPPSYSSSGQRYPFDKASLNFEGRAPLSSTVRVLRDGFDAGSAPVSGDSRFTLNLTNIDRGVYSFGFYAIEPDGVKSNTSNLTFSVISNTGNQITNIIIPPTIKIASSSATRGRPFKVSGYTIGGSSVEMVVYNSENLSASVVKKVIKSSGSGNWSDDLDISDFPNGTYVLRARSIVSASEYTTWTQYKTFGIGVAVSEDQNPEGSDINGDGKVNLIDFSILLFNWGSAGKGTASDLNRDDTVNLTDFSILLFNWTG